MNDKLILEGIRALLEYAERRFSSSPRQKRVKDEIKEVLAGRASMEKRLEIAEDLLMQAGDLMDNTHCYNTEIYKKIGVFLYGEEDDE